MTEMIDDACQPSVYQGIVNKAIKLKHPLDAMWELTFRCNLDCKHCYIIQDSDNSNEMDTETSLDLLDQLASAGVLWLTFSGGEPLLRDDLFILLERARALKFAVKLFTNGTLIDRSIAQNIARLKLSGVEISIYGASPEIHDPFTGIEGSFERSMKAVNHLKEFGVPVKLKTCLVRSNFEDNQNIVELCKKLEVDFRVAAYLAPRNDGSTDNLSDCRLTDEQLTALYKGDNEQGETINDMDRNPRRFSDSDDLSQIIPCSAGHVTCGITPDGQVLPCSQFVNGGESLKDKSFASIWRDSPDFHRIRKIRLSDVEPCNRCPGLNYCFRCEGIALLEDGDLLGPSSEACRTTRINMRSRGNEAQIPPA
ncbi:MAG: radical SAM protein [Calditrichaeota bacterium]|nr:radical SAM protein [Calditrichota bacterium]